MTIPRTALQLAVVLALAGMLAPAAARASWSSDPGANLLVAAQGAGAAIASDGMGGTIVAWTDFRTTPAVVYAQRLDASGNALWNPTGVPLTSGASAGARIVADGADGAIVAWFDGRNGSQADIYAQRVGPNGSAAWTAGGVPIVLAAGTSRSFSLASDGAGGAVCSWSNTTGGVTHVLAQRVSAAGVPQWSGTNGAPAESARGGYFPDLAPDGAGGALLTWFDYTSGAWTSAVQRIDGTGARRWGVDGMSVEPASGSAYDPKLVTDGAGGAVVSFFAGSGQVSLQRYDANGVALWTAGGRPLSTGPVWHDLDTLLADGHGGAFGAWLESSYGRLRAQHVDATGAALWGATGAVLDSVSVYSLYPVLAHDGGDGLIVAWTRYGASAQELHAQSISAAGVRRWGADGVTFCAATNWRQFQVVTGDGHGGLTAAWEDARGGPPAIYAQHVNPDGPLGVPTAGAAQRPTAGFELAAPAPSPARAGEPVSLRCALPAGASATLVLADVAGRRVRTIALAPGASGRTSTWDGRDDAGRAVAPGLYFVRLEAAGRTARARVVLLP